MRSTMVPSRLFTDSQARSAAKTLPKCILPEGLGAKRPTTSVIANLRDGGIEVFHAVAAQDVGGLLRLQDQEGRVVGVEAELHHAVALYGKASLEEIVQAGARHPGGVGEFGQERRTRHVGEIHAVGG